jgi:beta-glucanase (GH16 family)
VPPERRRRRDGQARAARATLVTAAFALAVLARPAPVAASAESAHGPMAPVGFSPGSRYRLVKDWDFVSRIRDQASLRREFLTRYVYGGGSLDHLNDEWSRYRDRDNHVFTPGGLSLVARAPAGAAPGAIESGMLRSRWSGEYGVFEIRMRVPAGRGMWPAFWLNPEDQRWPPEIDVVEIVNNGRDTTRQSFHFLHPDPPATPDGDGGGASRLDDHQVFRPGIDYAQGFHVFAVEWTPERVRHFVDGKLIADRPFRWRHDDGSDGGPAHLLVNLAVGGHWPGPPDDGGALPARLDIDYLRVWQRI